MYRPCPGGCGRDIELDANGKFKDHGSVERGIIRCPGFGQLPKPSNDNTRLELVGGAPWIR